MHFTTVTASAVAAGTLLLAIPAAANAATASHASPPCGSASGFKHVTQGQSVSQVNREMGAVGKTIDANHQGGHRILEKSWLDCGTHGLFSYNVSFSATPGHPLIEDSKAIDPTVPGE